MKSNKGFSTIAAGLAMTAASFIGALAVSSMTPAMRARQLDNSAQDVASLLQRARIASVERNAPVACRLEVDGSRTTLTIDWNLNGPKVHPEGERLVLPRGVLLMQAGVLQKPGVIAIFNPRGGARIGSVTFGSGVPAVLSMSRRGGTTTELREIAMSPTGEFEVAGGSPKS
jgi:Tfp pilus assembly protein FimT